MGTQETISLKSVSGNLLVSGFSGEYIFEQIRTTGQFYELGLLQRVAENSTHLDGLVVDVGANLGNHTLYFSKVLERQVIAFEPETVNFSLLRKNVEDNNLGDRVELHDAALWDKEGFVQLTQAVDNNNGTFHAAFADSGIPCVTLDSVVAGRPVAVVKIDVEGAEPNVLRGAMETLCASHPLVIAESHSTESKAAINRILEPLGYICIAIEGASDNYVWMYLGESTSPSEQASVRINTEAHRRAERFFVESRAQQEKALSSIRQISRSVSEVSKKFDALERTERALPANVKETPVNGQEPKSAATSSVGLEPEIIEQLVADVASLQQNMAVFDSRGIGAVEGLGERIEKLGKSLKKASAFNVVQSQRRFDELSLAQGLFEERFAELKAQIARFEDEVAPSITARVASSVLDQVDSLFEEYSASLVQVSAENSNALETFRRSLEREFSVSSNSLLQATERAEGLFDRVTAFISTLNSHVERSESARERESDLLAQLSEQTAEIRNLIGTSRPASFADSIESEFSGYKWLDEEESKLGAKFAKLLISYEAMTRRLEDLAPDRWNSEMLIKALHKHLQLVPEHFAGAQFLGNSNNFSPSEAPPFLAPDNEGFREAVASGLVDRPKYDPVRIGIASMAGREEGLRQVVEILSPQADEIFVYLNDMDNVPDILPRRPNVRYFLGPDTGDRGKFRFIEGFEGYYLTCDDDIAYAPFHVQSIIDGIERYDRKAVVGWHGSIFKPDFDEFYNAKYRQVLSFRFLRGKDTPVHLLGTGVCGFHTSTINVEYKDFVYPNMADAFLAISAKHQQVPMIVLAHGKDWATPIDVGPSISSVSLKRDKDTTKTLDVATTVTKLIKAEMPWQTLSLKPSYERNPMKLAFIGRTDKERWKKGGILKSAHLTRDMLERFSVTTLLEDIETGDPCGLSGQDADVVIIYVGDPERPDFADVEELIAFHATKGRHVIVNLSYNGIPSRSRFIVEKMKELRSRFGSRIWLMVFTEAMLSCSDLVEIRDWLVVIPKTISLPDEPVASFGRSEGIFIGDLAKLSNDGLLGYPGKEWVAAIRRALPNVPIYAVQQYKPKDKIDFGIDEIWPFMRGEEFARNVGKVRVMVSTVKYATFEMVPLEVASLGVPVIYPEMPQSLGEYLGLSGFAVRSPEQLERILPALYHDPIIWRSMSQAGIERAWSSELNRLAGQTYLRLIDLLERKN